MAGFIITYRFKDKDYLQTTYTKRLENFKDYFNKPPILTIEEETTSTIICRTDETFCNMIDAKTKQVILEGLSTKLLTENKNRANDDKIIGDEDVALFVGINKETLFAVGRIENLSVTYDSKIASVFIS